MKMMDPTYLRTIHDGLLSGAVHKDNASSLPLGLVGLYEKELPPARNVNDRKKFLEFFSVWALLKKEVSVAFVLAMLDGWTEEQVMDYFAQYSKWFNSPVSGKYVLYHERLRTFILQKVAQHQFAKCNETVIAECQNSLQKKAGDEWEHYALEHLSTHLLIAAMESQDGSDLIALAYHSGHWNRQIEISKNFKWSKNLLNDMMFWASKYDEDEVIECSLNKIDLYYLEQNDAPRIVELVAQNDLETALQRIESFGGNDKEGLQRKFILYMLCLMELTLLDGKDKPFRKEAIEKLLKHLDDNLPVDHSILKWNDFFPSYLMFQMACEWTVIGLDYLRTYKRTDDWEYVWIPEKGPYNDIQFEVLITCAEGISNGYVKALALKDIYTELWKQGKVEEAIICARGIPYESDKSSALAAISTELEKQGKVEEAVSVMQEALTCARGIDWNYSYDRKISALRAISTELAKQGRVEEALACTREINQRDRCSALMDISCELAKQGKVEEALTCARAISGGSAMKFEVTALKDISTELWKQGMVEESASAMQEALTCARGINDESDKSSALKDISTELAKQGKVEEALTCARGINDDRAKISALKDISTELAKQGMHDEAISCANSISNETDRYDTIKNISTELTKLNFEEEALKYVEKINNIKLKFQTLADILLHLSLKNNLIDYLMEDILSIINKYELRYDQFDRSRLIEISTVLNKNGLISKSEQFLNIAIEEAEKKDLVDKNYYLGSIVSQLIIQDKTLFALDIVHEKFDENLFDIGIKLELKKEALDKITKKLILQNDGIKILSVKVGNLSNQEKNIIINKVTSKLLNQNILNEPSSFTKEIKEAYEIFIKFRNRQEFEKLLNKSIDRAWSIDDISEYYRAESHMILYLVDIAIVLKEIGESEKSNELIEEVSRVSIEEISDEYARVLTLIKMYHKLKGKDFENIINKLKEEITIENIHDVIDNTGTAWRSILLKEISIAKYSLENLETAEKVSLEIERMDERIQCWMELAKIILEEMSWKKAVDQVDKFQNNMPKKFYLKGLANNLNAIECNKQAVLNSYRYYLNDIESLGKILFQFALNQLFFENHLEEKIQRYNRTLNIQWAIDIKNSFSAN